MKKQYFDKKGLPVAVKENRAIEASGQKWQLNVAGLAPAQLAKTCGLYEYSPSVTKSNGKPTRPGKLIFDDKKGTCTREVVELTPEEIYEQAEQTARLEFDAEQETQKEAEKEQKFQDWKGKKNTPKPPKGEL